MLEVLVGVEVWREVGRGCLLAMERLRLGLVRGAGGPGDQVGLSFSRRSNFGMEKGRGDIRGEISAETLRLDARSCFISW